MNHLVVVSDNHGETELLEKILERHTNLESARFVHCGDNCFEEENYDLIDKFMAVRGNYDSERFAPYGAITFTPDNFVALVTHGHLDDVKQSPMKIVYKAKEQGANLVLHGHSHIAFYEEIDGVHVINPGSLYNPKGIFMIEGKAKTIPSYALITLDNDKIDVKFLDPYTGNIIK